MIVTVIPGVKSGPIHKNKNLENRRGFVFEKSQHPNFAINIPSHPQSMKLRRYYETPSLNTSVITSICHKEICFVVILENNLILLLPVLYILYRGYI